MVNRLEKLMKIIEGILFAVGDVITIDELASAAGVTSIEAKAALRELKDQYDQQQRGIEIAAIGDGYQMRTRETYYEYVRKAVGDKAKKNLSPAALETLAIIAYNQPIIKSAIEHVRGVNSDGAVSTLLERGLIEDVGRLDAPGRPILYATTNEFLRSFSLTSLSEMPQMKELEKEKKEENTQLQVEF